MGGCEGVSRDLRELTGLCENCETFGLFAQYIYGSVFYKSVFIFTCFLPQYLILTSLYFGSSYQEGQQ